MTFDDLKRNTSRYSKADSMERHKDLTMTESTLWVEDWLGTSSGDRRGRRAYREYKDRMNSNRKKDLDDFGEILLLVDLNTSTREQRLQGVGSNEVV